MHQWSWECLTGSSVGSATTVANRNTKLQSVGVAVKHHAPTDNSLPSRQPQDHRGNKKTSKKVSFSLCRVLRVICRVLWQESHSFLKGSMVCRRLARGNWPGMMNKKSSKQKLKNFRETLGIMRCLTEGDC